MYTRVTMTSCFSSKQRSSPRLDALKYQLSPVRGYAAPVKSSPAYGVVNAYRLFSFPIWKALQGACTLQ